MQQDQELEQGVELDAVLAEMGGTDESISIPTPEGTNKETPVRIATMENIMTVVKMLMGSEGTILPTFPQKFHTRRDPKGEFMYLEEDETGVCKYVSETRIVSAVIAFCKDGLPLQFRQQFWKMEYKHAREVLYQWRSRMAPIDEPAMVLQKSKHGRTFHRLPFDLDASLPTPLFDEFMERTSNSRALMAWIGSIFDPKADTQQYVWIYGKGKNGKSTLGRFLKKCLGTAAAWKQVPGQHEMRFWTWGLLDKRLLIFGDCSQASFVTTATFKSITGGDGVQVEQKGGAVLDIDMALKVLFFSNKRPNIEDEEADTRRIIMCEAQPIKGAKNHAYEEILWEEAPGILAKCFDVYRAISGPRKDIPTDNELDETIFAEQDEKFDAFFQEHFEYSEEPKDTLPRSDINDCLGMWFRMPTASIPLIRQFKGYLKRRGIIETRRAKSRDNRDVNGYQNILAKKLIHRVGR
jgi:hypothetical protein